MRPLALFVAFFSLPVHAAPLEVATDIPPVAALVADVQGGRGTVTAVAPSDADVHHLSLRPSQARALAQADVAVWIGPGVTGWFGSAMNSLAPDTPALSLLPGAPVRLPLRGGDGTDPHVWMAPENAIAALDQIAEALSAADRDGARALPRAGEGGGRGDPGGGGRRAARGRRALRGRPRFPAVCRGAVGPDLRRLHHRRAQPQPRRGAPARAGNRPGGWRGRLPVRRTRRDHEAGAAGGGKGRACRSSRSASWQQADSFAAYLSALHGQLAACAGRTGSGARGQSISSSSASPSAGTPLPMASSAPRTPAACAGPAALRG